MRGETLGNCTRTVKDLETEMEEIDEAIVVHNHIIEGLRHQRYELFAQKQDWAMQEVFECAFENGFTAEEMMELLLNAIREKKNRNKQSAGSTKRAGQCPS